MKKIEKDSATDLCITAACLFLFVWILIFLICLFKDFKKDNECWQEGYKEESCLKYVKGDK